MDTLKDEKIFGRRVGFHEGTDAKINLNSSFSFLNGK